MIMSSLLQAKRGGDPAEIDLSQYTRRFIWAGTLEWEDFNAKNGQKGTFCKIYSTIVDQNPDIQVQASVQKLPVEFVQEGISEGVDFEGGGFTKLNFKLNGDSGRRLCQHVRMSKNIGFVKLPMIKQSTRNLRPQRIVLLVPKGKWRTYLAAYVPKDQDAWMKKVHTWQKRREREQAQEQQRETTCRRTSRNSRGTRGQDNQERLPWGIKIKQEPKD